MKAVCKLVCEHTCVALVTCDTLRDAVSSEFKETRTNNSEMGQCATVS